MGCPFLQVGAGLSMTVTFFSFDAQNLVDTILFRRNRHFLFWREGVGSFLFSFSWRISIKVDLGVAVWRGVSGSHRINGKMRGATLDFTPREIVPLHRLSKGGIGYPPGDAFRRFFQ